MIRVRVHTTLGHSTDESVLLGDSELYSELVRRLRSMITNMRDEHPDMDLHVSLTEDISVSDLDVCPACGDRDSMRL